VAQLSKKDLHHSPKKGSVAQLSKKDLHHSPKKGSVAQLNSALDFGSSGYRFESCRGHKKNPARKCWVFNFNKQSKFILNCGYN
jgi:hypothetical protein